MRANISAGDVASLVVRGPDLNPLRSITTVRENRTQHLHKIIGQTPDNLCRRARPSINGNVPTDDGPRQFFAHKIIGDIRRPPAEYVRGAELAAASALHERTSKTQCVRKGGPTLVLAERCSSVSLDT
jgi:hypothetical protein